MINQNPFSLYDFMGYFIPGSITIFFFIHFGYFDIHYFSLAENVSIYDSNLKFDVIFFFVVFSYSVGHIINFLSSMTIEKYSNWRYNYPSKFLLGLEKEKYFKKNNITGHLLRGFLPVLILPVSFFDLIIGHYLNLKNLYTRQLDELLVDVIKEKCEVLFRNIYAFKSKKFTEIKMDDYDFFRIYSHYGFEYSKQHQNRLVNYVSLYGFLRSLAFISVLVFWMFVFKIITNENSFKLWYLIVVGLISYFLFMGFMKFYRRYTLEGLMIIVINKELSVKLTGKKGQSIPE